METATPSAVASPEKPVKGSNKTVVTIIAIVVILLLCCIATLVAAGIGVAITRNPILLRATPTPVAYDDGTAPIEIDEGNTSSDAEEPDFANIKGDANCDAVLCEDVWNMILLYEDVYAADCTDTTLLVDTYLLTNNGTTWTEQWYVDRCGENVSYTVSYVSSPAGGTDFSVTLNDD